jgi:hypothetical protein
VPAAHPVVVSAELIPQHRGAVSFLSHVKRGGDWILPRVFRAVAVMGNVELDLSCVRIGAGTSQIEILAVMGSVTILVPPDLRVECEGDPLVGSFEVKREIASASSPDAPLVRITGTAFMSSVEVKVVDPNAPGWFERLRARWSKKGG